MSCQNQPYQSFKEDLKSKKLPWDDIKLTRQANRGRIHCVRAYAWIDLFEYPKDSKWKIIVNEPLEDEF